MEIHVVYKLLKRKRLQPLHIKARGVDIGAPMQSREDTNIMKTRLGDLLAVHRSADWNMGFQRQLTGAALIVGPLIKGRSVIRVLFDARNSLFVVAVVSKEGRFKSIAHATPEEVLQCIGELRRDETLLWGEKSLSHDLPEK